MASDLREQSDLTQHNKSLTNIQRISRDFAHALRSPRCRGAACSQKGKEHHTRGGIAQVSPQRYWTISDAAPSVGA
jgi:hypothetical protein